MSRIYTRMQVRDRVLTVDRTQDVEPFIEHNKKLKNEAQSRKASFRHIGSIPNIFLEKWMNEEYARGHLIRWWGPEMDELIAKKLRDPDYSFLRVDK